MNNKIINLVFWCSLIVCLQIPISVFGEKDGAKYRLTVVSFENSTPEPDSAGEIKGVLLEEMSKGKPDNIELVESVSQTYTPPGRVKGIDGVVLGDVLSLKIETNVTSTPHSESYISGTRRVPNPRRDQLQQEIEHTRYEIRDFEQVTIRATKAGIGGPTRNNIEYLRFLKNKLSSLQAEQASTSQYIAETEWSTQNSATNRYSKTAYCRVNFRLVDARSGRVIFSDTAEASASDSSGTTNLVSDQSLKNEVVSTVAKKIAQAIFENANEKLSRQ